MAIDPYETIENLNHALTHPKESIQGAVNEVKWVWNEEVVNGSTEDRSRLAGAAAFEIVMALIGIEEAKAAKAAQGVKAGAKAADLGKAAKAADAIDDASDISIASKRVNRLGQTMDTVSDIGDASRGVAGSLKARVSGMLNRALTSDTAKKMIDQLDDLERDIRRYLHSDGPEARLVPEIGIIDDVDRVGTSRKVYDRILNKIDNPISDSGIKIRKAEIIEDAGDLVDDVGEYGKVVGKGGNIAAGPGTWEKANEAMSDASREYQKFVTGAKDGMVYRVNDVKFDGFKDGVLIEVKANYSNFVDKKTGSFKRWFTGEKALIDQARRQLIAANGTKIQWFFNDELTLNAIKELLTDKGITEIEFIFKPMQ